MIEKEISETKESPTKFVPSPGRLIKFSDGTVKNMNRAERSKYKIYNKDFKKAK